MGAKLRSELFCPEEQAIVHTMNRCAQQRFLLGLDRSSGKNFGHRRQMFENELRRVTCGFAIDMLSFAIMDNHFHLILRSRPDVALKWSDLKVIEQWHKLCPIFRDENGFPVTNLDKEEVAEVAGNAELVAKYRRRLSDISWFMKLVSQKVAKLCNAEEDKHGHFWEGRFKAVLLLDERAMMACSMYVDLNRVQAALAASLEESDFTSVQRRLRAQTVRTTMSKMMAETFNGDKPASSIVNSVVIDDATSPDEIPTAVAVDPADEHDGHLSPIHIDEKNDPIGPHLSKGDLRCSDKGFLAITLEQYIELLRWTADQIVKREGGRAFEDSPQVLAQFELEPDTWCKLTTEFTDLFYVAAGMPESVDAHRSCGTNKRFHMPQKTRDMLSA